MRHCWIRRRRNEWCRSSLTACVASNIAATTRPASPWPELRRPAGPPCRRQAGILEEVRRLKPHDGTYGIGHTRWATHGRPTGRKRSSPPRLHRQDRSRSQRHRGELPRLKKKLIDAGHTFKSETDTEVIAHLVEKNLLLPHRSTRCRWKKGCSQDGAIS